jgi:peptidoglycan/LPS O-acetylase OafA/YrhL
MNESQDLWHLPILYKLKEYLLGYQANIDILPWFSTIGIALIIFTSVLSYMIIERPFLKIRHHRKKIKY